MGGSGCASVDGCHDTCVAGAERMVAAVHLCGMHARMVGFSCSGCRARVPLGSCPARWSALSVWHRHLLEVPHRHHRRHMARRAAIPADCCAGHSPSAVARSPCAAFPCLVMVGSTMHGMWRVSALASSGSGAHCALPPPPLTRRASHRHRCRLCHCMAARYAAHCPVVAPAATIRPLNKKKTPP